MGWASKFVAVTFVSFAAAAVAIRLSGLTLIVSCAIVVWLYCGLYFVNRLRGKVAYIGAIAVYPSDSPLMRKMPDAAAAIVSLMALYGMLA